jgi:hypothetical protein
MTSKSSSDAKFEIGHVLFIDNVGYSKLLIQLRKRSWFALQLRINPLLDSLCSDPRFETLVQKIFAETR